MASPPIPPGAALEPAAWRDIDGWLVDDHRVALAVFASTGDAPHAEASIRTAQAQPPGLAEAIARCRTLAGSADREQARTFFETVFDPFRIRLDQGRGFLTAYFEPEFLASRERTAHFSAPVLARPADLLTFPVGEAAPPPLDPKLAAARQTTHGLEPYPTRTEIETGALDHLRLERAYMHPVDLFFMQVQGSGRLTFSDGGRERYAYAGRNGHPYTSIGKVIVAEGHMTLEGMTLEKLMGWLKDNPSEALRILRRNESYVFFRRVEGLSEDKGPIGGAGISLTPHRSIAIDRTLWAYGLPFWLETDLPLTLERSEPVKRLMIAQDTGSAILGPARADYYMGSGAEAGQRAGLVRQAADFILFWPRP
jgi:membrane-bound lytic murein transglycosylase A